MRLESAFVNVMSVLRLAYFLKGVTVIKKNAYTAAGYKYESPSEQSSIHIFAYTL